MNIEAPALVGDLRSIVNASLEGASVPMLFRERVVDAAVTFANDLYEPTLEVSDTGAIYVTGHTILADTTGAPVFVSKDDGNTWTQLPFASDLRMAAPLHGATPPPSDEIFLVAGDDGWLWGVDITLATFPVNGWSGNGTRLDYHNPNAYDEHQAAMQASDCVAAPVKDRPWAAYANGTLLMVSNPASGPAQVGVLRVPPDSVADELPGDDLPVGAGVGAGAAASGGWWNLCAGPGRLPAECGIPGLPDIRADGLFAVPQRCRDGLYLMTGNQLDVMDIDIRLLFPHTSGNEITSLYGHAAFDKNGTLFVGITNNTRPDEDGNRTGNIRVAASRDGGATFVDRTFSTGLGAPVRHLYIDANKFGPGALMVWALNGTKNDDNQTFDWYAGHLQVDDAGNPTLVNAFLIVDDGPAPSAHVTGAAVGPDGRAYTAMFRSADPLGTPISVWVQEAGPTLPVSALVEATSG